jgi:hypothetical protein
MLNFLLPRVSDRKARLLAVAYCRRLGALLTEPLRSALDVGEMFADAPGTWIAAATNAERAAAEAGRGSYGRAQQAGWAETWREWALGSASTSVAVALAPRRHEWSTKEWLGTCASSVVIAAGYAARAAARTEENANGAAVEVERATRAAETACQCHLARCVAGFPPFHSARISPSWRTDTVLALARQMYDAREFSAMPILADALQDAGCDNEDVLAHCRGPGPHVRGCWVVDFVLGKA